MFKTISDKVEQYMFGHTSVFLSRGKIWFETSSFEIPWFNFGTIYLRPRKLAYCVCAKIRNKLFVIALCVVLTCMNPPTPKTKQTQQQALQQYFKVLYCELKCV